MSQPTRNQFDNQISVEAAYQLICTQNADEGGQDAISARGWIKHSSWMGHERIMLVDGSYIYRDPAYGFLCHANVTAADVLADFSMDGNYPTHAEFIARWCDVEYKGDK